MNGTLIYASPCLTVQYQMCISSPASSHSLLNAQVLCPFFCVTKFLHLCKSKQSKFNFLKTAEHFWQGCKAVVNGTCLFPSSVLPEFSRNSANVTKLLLWLYILFQFTQHAFKNHVCCAWHSCHRLPNPVIEYHVSL